MFRWHLYWYVYNKNVNGKLFDGFVVQLMLFLRFVLYCVCVEMKTGVWNGNKKPMAKLSNSISRFFRKMETFFFFILGLLKHILYMTIKKKFLFWHLAVMKLCQI